MKVLQAMGGAEYGGAEAFFIRLVTGLHRAGLEQRAVIGRNAKRAEILRSEGLETAELPFGGIFDLRTRPALKREIKAFGPDIVLSWMSRAARLCPKGEFIHVGRLGGYYDPKYYRSCDHLIGNTEDIADYLRKVGWPADRIHYLPNFVADRRAEPVDRRELFAPPGMPLLLAMGRLHDDKAFDVLLEALPRIPNAYLWLAGEGPLRGQLEKQAERLAVKHRVCFLGWREDTAALLAACDVFVCPSRIEPLGNVVIEAWAQSIPVVAADSLGPGKLVEHMKTGMLTPVDDARSLAQTIRYVLEEENVRERIARDGRAAYEEHFTEASVIGQYLDFFQRILP